MIITDNYLLPPARCPAPWTLDHNKEDLDTQKNYYCFVFAIIDAQILFNTVYKLNHQLENEASKSMVKLKYYYNLPRVKFVHSWSLIHHLGAFKILSKIQFRCVMIVGRYRYVTRNQEPTTALLRPLTQPYSFSRNPFQVQ